MANDNTEFKLNPGSGVPYYRQIIDQVLLGLADGHFSPGAQLPTVRQLAVDLSVNLNTVAKAYREMEIRGIVETQQGTGTFISSRKVHKTSYERKKALQELVDQHIALAASKGISIDEIVEAFVERAEKANRR
ncbi:MAG TPA: GntR family transcriptional regulator [Thermoanaerobaculia bacterium]|nr:GntR family transcriptional regulator [Thermoanaerobaculia bacterium]